jgi:hypothetical protein
VIGIVAMLVQATGAPAFSAACSGGSVGSQWTPRSRRPVTFGDEPEERQRHDLRLILAHLKPAPPDAVGVLVTALGTRTSTVSPVPSSSFAKIALSASSAALDGP